MSGFVRLRGVKARSLAYARTSRLPGQWEEEVSLASDLFVSLTTPIQLKNT